MTSTGSHVVIDKRGRLAAIGTLPTVELELGCGVTRHRADAISIDALDYEAVDIVGDVFDVLSQLPDRSVDAIYSSHFVEHIEDLARLVLEIGRVLKPGGLVHTIVPHFSNPYFYSDYTHKRPFGLYSFSYLSADDVLWRKVPRYINTPFDLISVKLVFKAPNPFYIARVLSHVTQALVNVCELTKEWYERRLCFLLPCYEVEYVIRKQTLSARPNR